MKKEGKKPKSKETFKKRKALPCSDPNLTEPTVIG
jgi:hypothetical protein